MATRIADTRIEDAARSSPPAQPVSHRPAAFMLNPAAPLLELVREEPFVEAAPLFVLSTSHRFALAFQRGVDIALATLFLLILAPLMLGAAILVRLGSRGPIFYAQRRFGCHGEVFGCLKFRTMQVDAERLLEELLEASPALQEMWKRDRKLRDDPRITPFGNILRRYSIDELPQLFNVLRGEMSIVGPRPLATDEAHFYADSFAVYCSVKPGITGPWQVSGRNQISFEGRARLDCDYARTKSVGQDFRIILRTIPVVLRGTGY